MAEGEETRGLRGLEAALTVLGVLVVAGPFLVGRGVDVPDDALYSTVPSWEWLRQAVLHGQNPFWVPGRLGGVSLYAEANAMGPFYPGLWLAWLLPVHLALPFSMALHALGAALSTRWLARTFGASSLAATVAGVGVAAGPVGLAVFIECQVDVLALYVWFPVVLACHRRLELAEGRERLRWLALGAGALALMLMGSHVRHAAGACGALGVWFLLRWRVLPWAAALTALGVLGGATGVLPALLEWKAAQGDGQQVAALAIPPLQTLRWSFLASWLAPKPFVTAREFSLGAVLAASVAFGLRGRFREDANGSLVAFVAVLLLAAAALPGVRWALAPLTLLAHPTLILYYALAMVPAAVLGARGLDRLLAGERGGPVAWGVLAVVGLACVLRLTPLGEDTFGSDGERVVWALGLIPASAALLVVALALPRLTSPRAKGALVLVVAVAELAVLGIRTHRAVRSRPLELQSRLQVRGEDVLSEGSVHLGELAVLLEDGLEMAPSLQSGLAQGLDFDDVAMEGEVEDVLEEAPEIQERLLDRRWPIHLPLARGWRSLSGRAKLAPPRQTLFLQPLLRALTGATTPWPVPGEEWWPEDQWDHHVVAARAKRALRPGGVGHATLHHAAIPVAVDELDNVWEVEPGPWCESPGRAEVEGDPRRRVQRILEGDPVALLEAPLREAIRPARVSCERGGHAVVVEAEAPALVVLAELPHPGWRVEDDAGRSYAPVPVDQIHQGVLVPGGSRTLRWSFRPPGLLLSVLATVLGFLVMGGLLGAARRTG